MKVRSVILLSVCVAAMVALLWIQGPLGHSEAERKADIAFGAFYIVLIIVLFVAFGRSPAKGLFFMPRIYWVISSSFAIAFAASMLISVVALWLGFNLFDVVLFGQWSWTIQAALAAAVFPVVRKRLL